MTCRGYSTDLSGFEDAEHEQGQAYFVFDLQATSVGEHGKFDSSVVPQYFLVMNK